MSLVLDNVVLSSFHAAEWFQSLGIYPPEERLFVSERIWDEEFLPEHDLNTAPDWLTVQSVSETPVTGVPGALSEADRTCLALAQRRSAVLVTNDKTLLDAAESEAIDTKWGTRFVIETFENCGISQQEFDTGVDRYRDDVYLPDVVAEKLAQAEKP